MAKAFEEKETNNCDSRGLNFICIRVNTAYMNLHTKNYITLCQKHIHFLRDLK